jgi:hypothetical protein
MIAFICALVIVSIAVKFSAVSADSPDPYIIPLLLQTNWSSSGNFPTSDVTAIWGDTDGNLYVSSQQVVWKLSSRKSLPSVQGQ